MLSSKNTIATALVYADDLILISHNQGLQNQIDILNDYCLYWNLTINTKMTIVMAFLIGEISY